MAGRKQKHQKLTFIDLFAGCGGLSEGFLQTGDYEALAHVEWEMPMVSTLRNRLVDKWEHTQEEAIKKVIHFDIQKTGELINGGWKEDSIRDFSKTNHDSTVKKGLRGLIGKKRVDMIIGGPPCQAYSIAGRAQDKNSMKDDYRNYLFESFVKVVDHFKPGVFVFENVPGLLSAQPGDKPVTSRIYEAFKGIGYEIRKPHLLKKSVYSAYDFGVPQKRKRIIIIGVRMSSETNLEELYQGLDLFRMNQKGNTVFEVMGHLPKYKPLKKLKSTGGSNVSHQLVGSRSVKHHEPRYHNNRDVEIFRKWIINGMNKRASIEKISFYNENTGKKSNHVKYRNLEWDKPSPTVVAHLYKDGLMFIHPDPGQARSITVKEAALLQSFPDDYGFAGSQAHMFKMIGNAVPPEMARNIALVISKKLTGK